MVQEHADAREHVPSSRNNQLNRPRGRLELTQQPHQVPARRFVGGPSGYVHALDVNAEFIARARARAEAAGLADRITAHLLKDGRLPLPNSTVDRIVARNTIIYVHDPVATFKEFRRVLKPAGIAHAVESDWSLTVVEPLSTAEWRELVRAASWAWRTPEIGRKLHGIVRSAGFSKVSVQVLTKPDADGRLLGMIETVAGYARESGALTRGAWTRPCRLFAADCTMGRILPLRPSFS